MVAVDLNINQETLDLLRANRRKLYAVPQSELSAMSLEDQVKYGDSLHQTGFAILKLEAARLKGVNDKFKEQEVSLKKAAEKLESDTFTLTDSVKVVRVASEGISSVTRIIKLLG